MNSTTKRTVLALLDGLVESELLLLGDAIEHDLVVHGRLDVTLGTEVLRLVVDEIVVAACQVGKESVKVASLRQNGAM